MSQYTASIQQLYVAYFGRPADAGGLAFWEGVVAAAGGKTAAISAAFAASNEYTTAYAGKSAVEIVNQVYVNLFGHDADPSGLLFWANALQNKLITIDNVVTAIAGGAQGTDKVAFDSKVTAATAFTDALDTTAEILGYNTAAIPAAKAYIAGVTDEATMTSAVAGVDAAVVTVVASGVTPTPAQEFLLTAGVNNFTGGAGNDNFIADETTETRVSLADVLVGGAGNDTLTIYNSKGSAPQTTGIETITLNTIAGNFNASAATGLQKLDVVAADGTNTFTVGAGVNVSLTNTEIANTGATKDDVVVVYNATATSATLTLNNVTSAGTSSDLAIKGAKLATLNIVATGSDSSVDALLTATDTAIDSYVITGDVGLEIVDALTLATNATTKANAITSTGLTGDLSYALGTVAANQNVTIAAGNGANTVTVADVDVDGSVTATFGSGKDDVTVSDATGTVSVNTGAGNDTVTVSQLDNKFNATDKETFSVNLGAGDDTLVIASALTEANLASGVTFAGGDGVDTLNIANAEYLALFDNATADVSVTGFEKLALQNTDSGTFNLSKVAGVKNVVLANGVNTGAGLVLSNGAAGTAIDWSVKDATTTAGGNIDVNLKDASGSADAVNLNVTLTSTDTTADTLTIGNFEVQADANSKAVETLNIAVDAALSGSNTGSLKLTSQLLTITTLDLSGGVTSVNVSGDGSAKISGYNNASTLVTVDASTSTGNNNLSVAAGTTFKGGSGADTFTGTQAQFAALAAVTGGAGADTVAITDTAATTATLVIDDKAFKNVSGVEAISFTSAVAGDFSWTLGGYANSFATGNSGVITATATALAAGDAGDDITVDASGLSGTNAIALTLKDTAVDATDAIAINVTGSAGADTFKVTEATAGAAVITVNAGAGNDTITVVAGAAHTGAININGGSGNDTITGSDAIDTIDGGSGADKITGGEGADKITGGTGADQIILTETTAAADIVTIAAGDSAIDARDVITGFAATALNADKLDLVTTGTIQANGTTDGADYNTIKSHSVTSGVITFDDVNTFAAAVTVSATNLSDVLNYLAANITGAASTVAFAYDSNGDGTNDATLVYQNNAAGNTLVELVGVTGITAVATTAAANTILVG